MQDFYHHAQQVTQQYLTGLAQADQAKVLRLFTPTAKVKSPLYGEMPAAAFYRDLFADTTTSIVELKDVLTNESKLTAGLFFSYQWTMANGKKVDFEVIDYLQFNPNGLIESLQIIYDTKHSREAHERFN